jgi:hypothetical protein
LTRSSKGFQSSGTTERTKSKVRHVNSNLSRM